MKGDYANGRIYKIEPICEHEEHEVYYGSTTQLLCKRMDKHRSSYKYWKQTGKNKFMSFELFDKYGVDNCKIYLVEKYPCESKEQLEAKEGQYIRNNQRINKVVIGRSKAQHYQDNKEAILLKRKQYCEEHQEDIIIKGKQYYLKRKEIIITRQNKKYTCLCGCYIRHGDKARHERTQKHQSYVNQHNISDNLILQIETTNKAYDEVLKEFNCLTS
jgi:hypothetical protein